MPRGKADAKPRGRMTAYAFFVQTCREEHKKKHPDENVIFAEFSKKCAERWKVSYKMIYLFKYVSIFTYCQFS
jgi:high mobility group protein B1